ncbi:MAG: translation elongation factor Ts [Patescibacteria group bacterium]
MNINIKIISQLRDQTGAGIGDCKAALAETGGDIEKAIEVLRKKGEIKAAKKADRETKEGLVALAKGEGKLAAVVLACETDFVSRGDDFIKTAGDFAKKLLTDGEAGFREWAEGVIKNELVVKIGENIQLADFGVMSGEIIGSYLHSNKKVAGAVVLRGGDNSLADEIAMQVAAMSPKYLNLAVIPADILEKEKEIYREQLKNENKPEAIWNKIIDGKLAKFYEENCLLNQIYIKDETKKISDFLGDAEIINFKRFSV